MYDLSIYVINNTNFNVYNKIYLYVYFIFHKFSSKWTFLNALEMFTEYRGSLGSGHNSYSEPRRYDFATGAIIPFLNHLRFKRHE